VVDKALFDGIPPFLAVARERSFTRAADSLGITPTAVSKAIRQLERRHGVVLFQRTTRSVALTEAGEALLAQVQPAADQIVAALEVLDGYQDRPTGALRLTLSRAMMTLLVEPIVADYRRLCPDVTLELSINEGIVDLASGAFDAGIRQGESVERDMVAVRLTPEMTWSVVASPAYLDKAGTPETPEDLARHEGILYRFVTSGQLYRWEFTEGAREFTVAMKGRLIVNDWASLLTFARQGLGLAYVMESEARADLAAGRLRSVLQDYLRPSAGAFLYFPERMQTQPKLRAFIDLLRQRAYGRPA
jgi:DNA-binding transcriptional LysR family regulator